MSKTVSYVRKRLSGSKPAKKGVTLTEVTATKSASKPSLDIPSLTEGFDKTDAQPSLAAVKFVIPAASDRLDAEDQLDKPITPEQLLGKAPIGVADWGERLPQAQEAAIKVQSRARGRRTRRSLKEGKPPLPELDPIAETSNKLANAKRALPAVELTPETEAAAIKVQKAARGQRVRRTVQKRQKPGYTDVDAIDPIIDPVPPITPALPTKAVASSGGMFMSVFSCCAMSRPK